MRRNIQFNHSKTSSGNIVGQALGVGYYTTKFKGFYALNP